MKQKIWYTYDDIHRVIKALAEKIRNAGVKYDAMIAIGGGGFIPARMLRCFLEIPIYAVTTALRQRQRRTSYRRSQKSPMARPRPRSPAGQKRARRR